MEARKAKEPVEIETDVHGRPALPDFAEGGRPDLEGSKTLIRAFVTAYYRECIHVHLGLY